MAVSEDNLVDPDAPAKATIREAVMTRLNPDKDWDAGCNKDFSLDATDDEDRERLFKELNGDAV